MLQYIGTISFADLVKSVPHHPGTSSFFGKLDKQKYYDVYASREWGAMVDSLWEAGITVTNEGYLASEMSAHYLRHEGRIVGYAINKVTGKEYSYVIETDKMETIR